jgi:hypothetical protein
LLLLHLHLLLRWCPCWRWHALLLQHLLLLLHCRDLLRASIPVQPLCRWQRCLS